MSLIRTFIAIDISAEVRGRAASLVNQLRDVGPKTSWTQRDNLHLTLKFLGDVEETLIPDVCRAAINAAKPQPAFNISCVGAGAFPSTTRPRTVWIGVREGLEELRQLHARLDDQLNELGFRKERRQLTPHLTIGRVREGGPKLADLGAAIESLADYDAAATVVEELVVYASYLDRTGPTYQVLGRGPLAAP